MLAGSIRSTAKDLSLSTRVLMDRCGNYGSQSERPGSDRDWQIRPLQRLATNTIEQRNRKKPPGNMGVG